MPCQEVSVSVNVQRLNDVCDDLARALILALTSAQYTHKIIITTLRASGNG